jgi:hypothetical protein
VPPAVARVNVESNAQRTELRTFGIHDDINVRSRDPIDGLPTLTRREPPQPADPFSMPAVAVDAGAATTPTA